MNGMTCVRKGTSQAQMLAERWANCREQCFFNFYDPPLLVVYYQWPLLWGLAEISRQGRGSAWGLYAWA